MNFARPDLVSFRNIYYFAVLFVTFGTFDLIRIEHEILFELKYQMYLCLNGDRAERNIGSEKRLIISLIFTVRGIYAIAVSEYRYTVFIGSSYICI